MEMIVNGFLLMVGAVLAYVVLWIITMVWLAIDSQRR
jgi:hypothetical protein